MDETRLKSLLQSFLDLPAETEWIEFKEAKQNFDNDELGRYFSALSNEANLKGKDAGWLIFGINDKTHQIVGSNYKPTSASLDAMKKIIADGTGGRLTFIDIYELVVNKKRVIIFQIPPALKGVPTSWKGHYYGRDSSSIGALNMSEILTIKSQNSLSDWSAQIVQNATIEDLDPKAIAKARILYKLVKPKLADEIDSWDDTTFLNKVKVTIKGKITNAAILLLGKEESEVLISPSVAKIKWILKDSTGSVRDYLIESCPFIFAVDNIYEKIRNLKYRYINPEYKTLFPEETIDTYEPYVIREAINNAIAHQDYEECGQINVVEFDDKLVFSNLGEFIPGKIERVLETDAPQERYRNPFLVNAMVNLNMVDTIGSGIRKMYNYQRKRLFPLPIYDISDKRVEVTITGRIIDINYANILAKNSDLSLNNIELLNRIQLNKPISDAEIKYLRKEGLIEGRKPHIYIAKEIAQKTKQSVEYSKHKGLNDKACEELLLEALKDHSTLTKKEITDFLWNTFPSGLDDTQKRNKIRNLLSKLRIQGKISNDIVGNISYWKLTRTNLG